VRITGQRIDATTGMHIWADRFDGVLTDIFELQDQVAASIVGAIEPKLRDAEIERARLKPAENMRAYDVVLRARFVYELYTREAWEEAVRLLRQAVEIEPDYALALALLARTNWRATAMHWTSPTETELAGYVQMAREAIRHNPDDPEVLVPAVPVIALPGGDLSGGIALVDRACMLNRNSADA
jgi:hypothetical protein